MKSNFQPIGVFDSGYGGLTILKEFLNDLPEFDFIYLGDNARAPYGSRSFEVVYEYTLQAVNKLFEMGCHLVILACNTASAKALRNIQQNDLPFIDPNRRAGGKVVKTTQEACPIWVPLVENNEIDSTGTEYFVSKNIKNLLAADPEIDSIILGCTH